MSKTFKSLAEFEKAFKKNSIKLKTMLRDTLPEIGSKMKEMVLERTRKGYGIPKNGQRISKLKKLERSYVDFRKKYKHLSSETTPAKSNLTLTGSMLDNLNVRTNYQKWTATLKPAGRDRYGISNKKKAGYAHDSGRPFLYLSPKEEKELVKIYEKDLNKIIKKLF